MDILSMVITIAIVGLIVGLITMAIPMPPLFRQIILAVAAIGVLLYVLSALGALPGGTVHHVIR